MMNVAGLRLVGGTGVDDGTVVGSALAVLLLGIGIYYAARVTRGWLRREEEGEPEETRYFASRRVRRLAGALVMIMIGLAMGLGVWVDPRAGRLERQVWGWCWVVAMGLALVLLTLGMADWIALRRYAARQGKALAAERREVIAQERALRAKQKHAAGGDGEPGGSNGRGH